MSATLAFATPDGGMLHVRVETAIVAGWTARDRAAVDHHIEELAAIGVPAPSTVPLYYRVAASLLTQDETIEVVGEGTSGEAEPVVISDSQGRPWLTVGSDHTDRALEATSVALSKQICAKPLARAAWPLASLMERLDALTLASSVQEEEGGPFVAYQAGTLATIRPLAELIAGSPVAIDGRLPPNTAMLCGTLPVLAGGVRPARAMRLEIGDGEARLAHEYATRVLPVVA
ncbi:DUF2848 family protein [Salinarimonas ramus]|uniref:DUF2848 domain-containing protein n=1 Tax=Salinarimonas ramus TaxID=690164 RepID=A0A917QD34_9HYPH|nr:DUF2848 family protein [Salinarimonas ramus]GGK44670.1 hypothetical protein GCM10011322_34780 [Salinarimonas ramus]